MNMLSAVLHLLFIFFIKELYDVLSLSSILGAAANQLCPVALVFWACSSKRAKRNML